MQTKTIYILLLAMISITITKAHTEPLETVDYVDIDRYLGKWYQIAFFPTRFQKADCGVIVTAEYGIDDRGRITVENTCWADDEMTEPLDSVTGTASVVSDSNAKLKVRFFWWLPFRADFWIIKLDQEDYQYAVVSEPRRRYLWIIARESRMDESLFDSILDDLENRGFDLENLAITAPVN